MTVSYQKIVRVIFFYFLLTVNSQLSAQVDEKVDHDSSYYTTYHEDLIFRVYVSRKYNYFGLKKSDDTRLMYRPNTNTNIGLGVTYRTISLNAAVGLGLLNPENGKGRTKKLDLQSRLYGRNWLIDLSGEFFDGYYLSPKGKATTSDTAYYTRPDLAVSLVGVSAYRLLNSRKMTFRHGFIHDELQRRSAGSFLIGGAVNYARVNGDSSLVPARATRDFNIPDLRKTTSVILSPGIGYAYTLVLPAKLYVSGAATGQLDLGIMTEDFVSGRQNNFSVSPSLSHKLSAGYFDGTWHIGGFWVNNRVTAKGASGTKYLHNTGLFRVILSRRFETGRKAKKLLKPVDRLLDVFLRDS